MTIAFFAGLRLSLALISVIGAQNAFVLRQGLRREHVLAVVAFCAISDALLIAAGVAGLGVITDALPGLRSVLLWGGVAFLVWYGARAFRSAWRGGESLRPADGQRAPLGTTLATLAALTWLNPHVWLDTVVLLGSVAAQYPGAEAAFAVGAALGSLLFFATLGYGARLLAPVFARPAAWRVLDAGVGLLMWSVAAGLVLR
ncbi:MAG: LysE/ArgO family amino acid transporter [Pseudomonadota bacterium]